MTRVQHFPLFFFFQALVQKPATAFKESLDASSSLLAHFLNSPEKLCSRPEPIYTVRWHVFILCLVSYFMLLPITNIYKLNVRLNQYAQFSNSLTQRKTCLSNLKAEIQIQGKLTKTNTHQTQTAAPSESEWNRRDLKSSTRCGAKEEVVRNIW